MNLPVAVLLVALAGFAHHYLDARLRWLAVTAIALRLVSLVINFSVGESGNFLHAISLTAVPLMGEQVAMAVGTRNPWRAIGQAAVFLLMLYFFAASVHAWRQGRRVAAVLVGGSLTFFMMASLARAVLVSWEGGNAPSTVSLFALGVVGVMGYALSADLLRAKQLVVELSEREREADLVADAANLGTWTRDIVRDTLVGEQEVARAVRLRARASISAPSSWSSGFMSTTASPFATA